jgi:hypothetical protein
LQAKLLNQTAVQKTLTEAQISGITIGFLGVILLFIMLIYCIFPIEILATLFGMCPSFYQCCPCKSGVITSKYYDVFVSYNKSAENWVKNQLVPFLDEKGADFKYFLHYGSNNKSSELFNQFIKEKMSESSVLLLILNDAFILNEWDNKEYKEHVRSLITNYSVANEEKTRLLCVQLDDIADEEVDDYIRDNLQIPKFISLENGEFYFWSKLNYFLHVNRVEKKQNNKDDIILTTRDLIPTRKNDLLNFQPYKIKAPIVHMPNMTEYKKKSIQKKTGKEETNSNSESPLIYTSDMVHKSILNQLASKRKHQANEILINLDKAAAVVKESDRPNRNVGSSLPPINYVNKNGSELPDINFNKKTSYKKHKSRLLSDESISDSSI